MTSDRWTMFLSDMVHASQEFYRFLCELDSNPRCQEILRDLSGMPIEDDDHSFTINARLGFIVYCDLRDCFQRLGYSTDQLNNLEGMGFAMLVSLLVCHDFDINRFYDRDQARFIVHGLEKLDHESCAELDIKGYENELRFAVIFGLANDEKSWVQRYATLLYRWASLIAKADGFVTAQESEMLASIMKIQTETPKENESPMTGSSRTVGLSEPIATLDGLIGLGPVKEEVHRLVSFLEIQRKRSLAGLRATPTSYHCVFTGSPGTGKTTIARILAAIYRDLGILKKGHLVETDRSGLVGEYVGQTAVKTNKIIDSALDGVLFIDEAYSLVSGNKEDYGAEAIATLLKRMEDDRDRLVVILAGYPDEIQTFIDSNPGLQSRFNRYIQFPDYSAEELAQIFLLNAEESQYKCTDEVRQSLVQIMEYALSAKDRNFGNGRYVRNLFEKAIERQAVRLSSVAPLTVEMLTELTLHDLGFSYET